MGTKFVPPVIAFGFLVIAFSEGKLSGEKIVASVAKPASVLFAEEEWLP